MISADAATLYARDPACRSLGIVLDAAGPGRARMRMRVTDEMANMHGVAHGGYVFLLADAAFGYACNSHGRVAVAQGAQVTFLRPVPPGVELVAEAVERSRSGTHGVYDVTVRGTGGEVVAELRGHGVQLARPLPTAEAR